MLEAGPWLRDVFAEPAWLWLLALVPAAALLGLRARPSERSPRRLGARALRSAALAVLVVALAGPLHGSYSSHTDVVFALDASRSVGPEPAAQALDFVNRAFASKPPDARMGLVVFAADAQVEALLRRRGEPVGEIAADVGRGATDIGRALEVAVGALPSREHRRVVLLSDGRENRGDARAAAVVARSMGVEIVSIALDRAPLGGEVSVRGIVAPPRVNAHEPFRVQVTVHSDATARAQLLVMRNGALLHEREIALEPGMNAYALFEEVSQAGLHEYEAIVISEADFEHGNNRYQAFVEVVGAPKVLHALGRAQDGGFVSAALRAQGLAVEEVPGTALPGSMHQLADYDLVILDNVSAFDLSLAKLDLLEGYVRDAGGGLIAIGGDRSYGAGGYYDTAVERVLPVTMDVPTTVKIPSLAVIFVLDRSGSMGSRSHGEEKITIARNAALASIDLLNRLDRVGILAFDDAQEWIVPPTEVGNRRPITERLRSVGAGGSTDLVSALEEAHRVMSQEQAKVKHLIVLSDGLAGSDVSFEEFGARIESDGITVSTVALGTDADQALMARLAALGQGRYYHTDDPRNVPRIFSNETMVVARNLVVERETRARPSVPGEMLRGFAPDAYPVLRGYQRVFAKPAAQVLLETEDREPLLVTWRYGLGKAVAFTSDLTGRWGREWVRWPEFGRFVSQMARWSMRRSGRETLLPEFRADASRAELLLDVLDRDERFVNGLAMRASVTGPDRSARELALEQIAPGRYRGEFPLPGEGRYYVSLSGRRDELQVGPRTFGFAVPYSSEYLELGVDRALLEEVAAITGGRVLPLDASALPAIFAREPTRGKDRWRIWWPLVLAALALLVLEVALRKVPMPETWLARLRRAREERAESAAHEPDYEALRDMLARAREEHLTALRERGYYDADDPAVRARLWVARGGKGRRRA